MREREEVLLTDFQMRDMGSPPHCLLDERVVVLQTDFRMRERGASPD